MEKKKSKRSMCPICQSLDVFGDKWSLLIIRDIMIYGKNTYGDFLKMEEGIATNILADRLVSLEREEIISKEVFVGSKSKFTYKLTKKGIDLIPIALELIIWGGKYYEILPQMKEIIMLAQKDKETFIKDMASKLMEA
jgi:DNA-binding HxlR family transcriptional regulator